MSGKCLFSGKVCYTQAEADNQARWWRSRRLARMHAYRCKGCRFWHIGNSRRPARKRVQR